MSLNATARISKKSVIDWDRRFGALKPTLMLYSLLHQFVHQEVEGDELYTKVEQNKSHSQVPAVRLGIVDTGISWSQLLTMRYAI